MENDNITKGVLTELKCSTKLIELGYNIAIPQKPTRYDFIIDTGIKLFKVQAKTCSVDKNNETIYFPTESRRKSTNKTICHHYKNDNIDFFCTWYNNECYLIPVEDCGIHEKRLRLCPTRNGQIKNIAFAKDYLAQEVLSKLL